MAPYRGKLHIVELADIMQNINSGEITLCTNYIFRSLRKLAEDNPKQWNKFLQPAMFALRTQKQLTTQFSPYFLLFGREAKYPSEGPQKYEVGGGICICV